MQVKPLSPTPSNENNNWKSSSSSKEEELKREEALLEDEMKEDDDDIEDDDDNDADADNDVDIDVGSRSSAPIGFGIAESLKRHFENNEKLAMIKSMMEKPQVSSCLSILQKLNIINLVESRLKFYCQPRTYRTGRYFAYFSRLTRKFKI